MKHLPKAIVYGVIALIVVFVIAASMWYKQRYGIEQTNNTAPVVTRIVEKENTIIASTTSFLVDVEYPSIIGSKEESDSIKSIFRKRVDEFVRQAQENERVNNRMSSTTIPTDVGASYYTVSFSEEASTTRYLSFFVSSETYYVGMAHPMHSIDTFIFDKKTNRLVSPKELFVASSSYLQELSVLTRADFAIRNKVADADHVIIDTTLANEGLAPREENFSKVLPIPDGLMIYFTEYQIAPYAAGPQQAVIPYSTLKKIINPEGVLGGE